jgi:hypothetical protein
MNVKVVYNNIIPFEGFIAFTFIPWIFVRENLRHKYDDTADRHEHTHVHQQVECLVVGAVLTVILLSVGCGWWSLIPLGFFFELYLLEWLLKWPICFVMNKDAYRSISFEQEAYEHEEEVGYNNVRKHFAWVRDIITIK